LVNYVQVTAETNQLILDR